MKKVILWLLAIAVCCSLVSYSVDVTKDNKRLTNNMEALLNDCDAVLEANNSSMAKIDQLNMSVAEYEKYCGELEAEVSELGIKNARLERLVKTSTKTELRIDTFVRDSFIYVKDENRLDTLQCFNYYDNWVELSGCINKSTGAVHADFASYDTLMVVAHRVPKKWWFFRWGTKKVELLIKSKNPHSTITHAKYIEFSKN